MLLLYNYEHYRHTTKIAMNGSAYTINPSTYGVTTEGDYLNCCEEGQVCDSASDYELSLGDLLSLVVGLSLLSALLSVVLTLAIVYCINACRHRVNENHNSIRRRGYTEIPSEEPAAIMRSINSNIGTSRPENQTSSNVSNTAYRSNTTTIPIHELTHSYIFSSLLTAPFTDSYFLTLYKHLNTSCQVFESTIMIVNLSQQDNTPPKFSLHYLRDRNIMAIRVSRVNTTSNDINNHFVIGQHDALSKFLNHTDTDQPHKNFYHSIIKSCESAEEESQTQCYGFNMQPSDAIRANQTLENCKNMRATFNNAIKKLKNLATTYDNCTPDSNFLEESDDYETLSTITINTRFLGKKIYNDYQFKDQSLNSEKTLVAFLSSSNGLPSASDTTFSPPESENTDIPFFVLLHPKSESLCKFSKIVIQEVKPETHNINTDVSNLFDRTVAFQVSYYINQEALRRFNTQCIIEDAQIVASVLNHEAESRDFDVTKQCLHSQMIVSEFIPSTALSTNNTKDVVVECILTAKNCTRTHITTISENNNEESLEAPPMYEEIILNNIPQDNIRQVLSALR